MKTEQIIELTNGLAEKIAEKHDEAQRFAKQAKERMTFALESAVQCGAHIHDAEGLTKGQLLGWLRDHVPNLEAKQAKAYLSLFHTDQVRKQRGGMIDYRQMHLLPGMFEDTPSESDGNGGDKGKGKGEDKPKAGNSDAWGKWTARLRGWVVEAVREQPVAMWSQERRDATAAELKPLADLYHACQS